jgi:hypothetical protein
VTAVYDRHGYEKSRGEALSKWDTRVAEIVRGPKEHKIRTKRGLVKSQLGNVRDRSPSVAVVPYVEPVHSTT